LEHISEERTMISLNVNNNQIAVTVMGQFTLDDYREFEQAVCYGIQFQGTVNLLFDLRDMLSYSVDVAWEELKFSREHKNDFGRIASSPVINGWREHVGEPAVHAGGHPVA
jgi:hypothetical protein